MSSNQSSVDENALTEAQTFIENTVRKIVGEGVTGDTEPGELPGLAGRIMEHTGHLAGKYDPPVALSTHTINVITTGVTVYAYDRIVRQGEAPDMEEVRLLVAALALHDANKYIQESDEYNPDFEAEKNTGEVLDFYFDQGDDFNLKTILPGESEAQIELGIYDVKWLVQRTETTDATLDTRGEASDRVRDLERYCRVGDGFVSAVHEDDIEAGVDWLQTRLDDGYTQGETPNAHRLGFNQLEQATINNQLITTVKAVIEGETAIDYTTHTSPSDRQTWGVVIGSTPSGVIYLGEPIPDDILRDRVEAEFADYIQHYDSYSVKANWQSLDYNVLDEINIPHQTKRDIIIDGYTDSLQGGNGTDHEFAEVPDGFQQTIPELVHILYEKYDSNDARGKALEPYSALHQLWVDIVESDDSDIQTVKNYTGQTYKIGFLCETLRRYNGSVDDGYESEEIRSDLDQLQTDFSDELRDRLDAGEGGVGKIVDRFIGGTTPPAPKTPVAGESCFLCGAPATVAYQKGQNGFYGTNKFSKRTAVEEEYKKICPVCNLEHALLRGAIEDASYSVDEDIKIATIYYDGFVADLGVVGSADPSGLIRALQGRGDDDEETVRANIADPRLLAASFSRQYHFQPLYIDGENGRLEEVRQLLETMVERGLKVSIGKPFSGFNPRDALFYDADATRLQVAYGADRIDSHEELQRVTRLFDILDEVGYSIAQSRNKSRYNVDAMTQLRTAEFESIAAHVARETERGYDARNLAHNHFNETAAHNDQYMQMKDVAQAGFNLYGYEYDSRYKKTKLFRIAIDATLDGLNRGKTDEQLIEYVTGQVYKPAVADAENESYVQPDEAKAFVEAIFGYLDSEDDGLDKTTLSQRRETLSNTYLFAYDQLLDEKNSDDGEEADDAVETTGDTAEVEP